VVFIPAIDTGIWLLRQAGRPRLIVDNRCLSSDHQGLNHRVTTNPRTVLPGDPREARPALPPLRSGKELILATKPFAVDDPARSWGELLGTICLLAAALCAAGSGLPLAFRIVSSVGAGLLLLRLFVIHHDQQHHAILSRSAIADGLMRVIGILLLSPKSVWNSSHSHHHNHNSRLKGSHIGSYPVMTTAQYAQCSRAERRSYLLMRHPATILFGYVFLFLFGMCILPFTHAPRKHGDSLVALLVHAALALLLFQAGGWGMVTLVLILPSFLACAFGSYLFYAQHNFPGVTYLSKDGWTYEGAALESSSFLETGAFMGWVTANIGYHHIHHLNARIPFYRLPEAMAALPELQHPKTTSLHPREILRCLNLKLWDVEQQRMVAVPAVPTIP